MVLEVGVADVVPPAHHDGVLHGRVYRGKAHLEVVSFRVHRVSGRTCPAHERTLIRASCLKLNHPVVFNRLFERMAVNVLSHWHVNSSYSVLELLEIGPRVGCIHGTA